MASLWKEIFYRTTTESGMDLENLYGARNSTKSEIMNFGGIIR